MTFENYPDFVRFRRDLMTGNISALSLIVAGCFAT